MSHDCSVKNEISYDDSNHPMKEMMMVIAIFRGTTKWWNRNGKVISSRGFNESFFRFVSMKPSRCWKTTLVSCIN